MKKFLYNVLYVIEMALILGAAVGAAYLMVNGSQYLWEKEYTDSMADGQMYLNAQEYTDAVEAFEVAYLNTPSEEAAVGLAKAWFGAGDTEKAITVLANRMGLYESTEEMEGLLKEYKEAMGIFDKIIVGGKELNPADTMIYIKDVTLTAEELEILSQFTEVVTLHLENCGISDISFLKDYNKLMSVTLTGNPISDFTVLADKPDLRTLYINDTAITDFSQLHQFTQLSFLNANGNWITSEQADALDEALPNIESYYGNDKLIETIVFAGISFQSDIEELDLSSAGITDTTTLGKCQKLKKLDLEDNRIGWISGLDKLTKLTYLNLNYNRLSSIDALKSLKRLEYFYAENNSITNISVLESMPNLVEVNLTGNKIYHGHEALAGLTKLQKLDIQNGTWTDKHLEYIPMDSMVELDVRGNRGISKEAITALAEKYPNCTIRHNYMNG